jgi:hypothetical protein
MKKMMLVLLMLVTVSCGVSLAFSGGRVAVVRNGEIFKVIYKSNDISKVKVTISDSEGGKIFSEELISTNGFIRPYNFSELPKGDYTVCVIDKVGEKTEKVCFRNEPWAAHIAAVKGDRKKVIVAVPRRSAKDFSILIFDKNEELVYNETPQAEQEYAKVFNLKSLEDGATLHLVNHSTGEAKSFRAE